MRALNYCGHRRRWRDACGENVMMGEEVRGGYDDKSDSPDGRPSRAREPGYRVSGIIL